LGADNNITLDGLNVHGAAVGGTSGNGIKISDSPNVTVMNSDIHNLGDALSHTDSDGLIVTGNTFDHLGGDGIHGGGSSNVLIADNSFTSFITTAGKHPDAIQFWTTNTTASAHDIVVRDNLILRGEGAGMQGIFITDQSGGNIPYENLTITGNTVIGGFYHGLTVYDGNNVLIDGNTVVGYTDMSSWIMAYETNDATVTNNITSQLKLTSPNTDLVSLGNSVVAKVTADTDDMLLKNWFANHSNVTIGSTGDLTTTFAAAARLSLAGDVTVTVGDAGANSISGSAGADLIDGGGGVDTLSGGAGDDLYIVGDTGDRIIELPGGGTDTVRSYAYYAYQLDANVENLILSRNGGQKGTGNDLDNVITANKVGSP